MMRLPLESRRPLHFSDGPGLAVLNSGWLNLTAFSDDPAIGTRAWVFATNAVNSDNSDASIFGHSGTPTVSHYLKGLQLVSGIPAAAPVVGIEVRIEKQADAPSVKDNTVQLVVGGAVVGANRADTVTGWGGVDAYAVYGGPSDLWGLALTAADVNAAGFGVVLAINSEANFVTATVDHIQIRVYYLG